MCMGCICIWYVCMHVYGPACMRMCMLYVYIVCVYVVCMHICKLPERVHVICMFNVPACMKVCMLCVHIVHVHVVCVHVVHVCICVHVVCMYACEMHVHMPT